jgi:hypothetical protein
MTTSIELTDQELAELKALTHQSDAEAAVRFATTEYLRFARRQRLKQLSGRVQMEENWTVLEESELEGQNDSG